MEATKNEIDAQFNAPTSHPGIEPLAGRSENSNTSKATDVYVALNRSGDINSQANLAHFGISQAFAWEYLRKKKKATAEDLKYAQELQEEMERQLQKERELRQQKLHELEEQDEDFAKKLQIEENTGSQPKEDTLRDSQLARLIQAEEQSKVNDLLSDSEFARKIMNEVLVHEDETMRDSQLARILQEEFNQATKTSQVLLPEVLKQEEIYLRESNEQKIQNEKLPSYMEGITNTIKLKTFTPIYAPQPLSVEEIQSKIYLPNTEDMKNKYPKNSTVEVKNFNLPHLSCSVTVGGFLTPSDSCILSPANMALLELKTGDLLFLSEPVISKELTIQVEFQPNDWEFMSGPWVRNFVLFLVNERKEMKQGDTIYYQTSQKLFEIDVKHCQPNNSIFDTSTDTVFCPPPAPPVEQFKTLAFKDEETVVCPVDEYCKYKIEIPPHLQWLEEDFVLNIEVLAGNISVYIDQNPSPNSFSYKWAVNGEFSIIFNIFLSFLIFSIRRNFNNF